MDFVHPKTSCRTLLAQALFWWRLGEGNLWDNGRTLLGLTYIYIRNIKCIYIYLNSPIIIITYNYNYIYIHIYIHINYIYIYVYINSTWVNTPILSSSPFRSYKWGYRRGYHGVHQHQQLRLKRFSAVE